MKLETIIWNIGPISNESIEAARVRQNILTKPPGSLGKLEELSLKVAGISGKTIPIIQNKVVTVMAGDHGVVAEGVSAYPSEVTPQMVYNFLAGGAAINVLAQHVGARVVIVDMGVASILEAHPNLVDKKVAHGTRNIAQGPAMSHQQAIQSIMAGVSAVEEQMELGMDILATGDMGIGNTTPSAAIAAVLTGAPVPEIVGRGTGVDDKGLARKVSAVERALDINRPDPENGLDILMKVGGFEIGGLAGAILGAASHRLPIVIDGFISTAAAMLAVALAPQVRDYLIASHSSQERGHRLMLEWLDLEPLLDLNLRLGEGAGAVLALSLVEAACKLLAEMATFEEAGVSNKEAEGAPLLV